MITFDDISKPDFFACNCCHQPIPFLLAVVLHGIVLLFGQEHGYFGTVCPKCGKTILRKSSRKDSESLRTALNELGRAAGFHDELLWYYSVPHHFEEYMNIWDLPEGQRPIHSLLIPREEIERSPRGFANYIQDELKESENRMEAEYGGTLSGAYSTYFYGDMFLGPAMVVSYFEEDSIERLVEEENRSGRKQMPRYVFYDDLVDSVESFRWDHYTNWEFITWNKDQPGTEEEILNDYAGQRQFANNHDFLNVLCADLETMTKGSISLPSSIGLVMKKFPSTIQEQNLPKPEHFKKKGAEQKLRVKEKVNKLWEAFRKEEFQDQLSIFSQRFVLEYEEKSRQTTFSKKIVSDLSIKYLNDIYKSIKSPQEWNSIRRQAPEAELRAVQEVETRFLSFKRIISADPKINHLKIKMANPRLYQKRNQNYLLLGETGTGKELFAEAIHEAATKSANRTDKYLPLNCAGLPEHTIESELFGHKKGAFTDAKEDRIGAFEAVDGGTLFLDEIGELPYLLQAKLLRVTRKGEIQPAGVSKVEKVDVITIFATNRKLAEEVKQKTFREDLYYRINATTFEIPPLRERKGDIPLLMDHFIREFDREREENPKIEPLQVTEECMEQLIVYEWPGNVAEMENVVEHLIAEREAGDRRKIDSEELFKKVPGVKSRKDERATDQITKKLPGNQKVTDEQVRYWMEKTGGNKCESARKLGVKDKTILRHCKKMGIYLTR
jgi:transcriptional regulator with GAF, ATPase, and Fis domain